MLSFLFLGLLIPAGTCGQELPSQAPINPEFIRYLHDLQAGVIPLHSIDGRGFGFAPSPIDYTYLKNYGSLLRDERDLPTTYDLRSLGKVTSVKYQGGCGACWAFATYGSLESTLLTAETRDFSENNLKNLHGFDFGHCSGGNWDMSTAYLGRWSGPVNEADDPYNESSSYSPPGLTVQKHVQEVFIYPERTSSTDNDILKQAVVDHGAVMTSYYHSDTYYHSTNHAYYCGSTTTTNHAVAIVGWDNNYPASNFNSTPPGNGAFIVKNSWGTWWGENGYFYVSYYDANFAYNGGAVFTAEDTTNYESLYLYDPLGVVGHIGTGGNTFWGANIFTASANDSLIAVGTHFAVPGSSYQVTVYTNVTGGPTSGTSAGTTTGSFTRAGYHTIPLASPASLTSGQKFSIVIEYTTPGYGYPAPMEYAYGGYSSGATANAGESYYSSTGSSWTDLTTYNSTANFCIKGFTASAAPMEVPKGTFTLSGNDSSITLSWGVTCGTASNYAVYEGNLSTLGSTWDHQTVVCSSGLTETFGPGAGNRYYLVVPYTGSVEGDYGFGRPRGTDSVPCGITSQQPGECP